MSEDAGVETPFDTVTAYDWDSMLPRLNEFVVENYLPLSVYQLPMAECEENIAWAIVASRLLRRKGFEGVRQLDHTY